MVCTLDNRLKKCDVKTTFRKQNSSAGVLVPKAQLVESCQSLQEKGILGTLTKDFTTRVAQTHFGCFRKHSILFGFVT